MRNVTIVLNFVKSTSHLLGIAHRLQGHDKEFMLHEDSEGTFAVADHKPKNSRHILYCLKHILLRLASKLGCSVR